ncbi:MAG: hypothetical protein DKM50_02000 [Candidatus Margulisiibacteriota bacterium]|nr:MAG: hypothetical protein A2X43_05905 [Candidatus Margulisbacteria bacterium GWD2_39_127]OGI03309.1 MAG: hypothetical protein A2X42_08515 [Candidatus Margulisbacteria bacterium GWF2_38_17]OGI10349.1 MAG: hypothetical protein A2X41_11755 [Candidatus Margulisbacteria bacterium GWE2_39_32]PZM83676.1 MAG: hypothetical protein DKM50_02000 [Candidatus Margulisiibacteriota bacterium]HAR63013.1 hypothetical protein [Candidatus Margulisiibacteriota bacterium]
MNTYKVSITAGILLFSLSVCGFAANDVSTKNVKLDTFDEKLSYALGLNIGGSLSQLGDDAKLNIDLLSRGIKDRMSGNQPLITQEQFVAVMKQLQEKQKVNEKKESELAEKNLSAGQKFLANNKKVAGVIETKSGLQYLVLTKGTGAKPKATDRVSVHYRGTLINGTEFDSSYKRGVPATLALNGVIPGWTEALQLMNVGSKYKLFIPSHLGYGENGAGETIGPNSALIFEVELIDIAK